MTHSNDLKPSWRWPAWAIQIAMKLNQIHADQRRNQEKIMTEISDLKDAIADLKTEVGEAVTKFSETAAKLAEAVANLGDLAALKAAVTEATVDLEGTAKHLDEAFGTGTFIPSGN